MDYLQILSVLVLCIRFEQCVAGEIEVCCNREDKEVARIINFDQSMKKCSDGNYRLINSVSQESQMNVRIGIDFINGTCSNIGNASLFNKKLSRQDVRQRRRLPTKIVRFETAIDGNATVTFLSKKHHCCDQDEQFVNRRTHSLPHDRESPEREKVNSVSSLTYQGADSPHLSQLETTSRRYALKHTLTSEGVSHGPIQRSLLGQIPFCNVAHLRSSVACSGVVITPHHILTAAHCVHDGSHFDRRLQKMRVGVPNSTGFENRRVQRIHVPRRWLKNADQRNAVAGRTDSERAVYDFSVIELDRDISSTPVCPRNGTRTTITNSATGYKEHQQYRAVRAGLRTRLGFVSFPASGEHRLWQTTCSTLDQSPTSVRSGLLATSCPSLAGSSGTGVFAQPPTISASALLMSSSLRDLIGLVSHEARVTNNRSYMVVTILNQSKRRLICAMMESSVYSLCSNNMPNKHRFVSYSLHRASTKNV